MNSFWKNIIKERWTWGRFEHMIRVAADASSDPLWLSNTCDFKKKVHRLFCTLKKYCCDQPNHPQPNPPVPPSSWCSTRAQEEMAFSKTYRIWDPQRTILGSITACRLWIWNFSSALWVRWFGQVTPSKSITWWARGGASKCGHHYTAWLFPFLPVDPGQVTSPRWKLSSVKWR